jgi:hypothetical protein
LQKGEFSLEALIKTTKIEKSKQALDNILAIEYLMKEIKMSLQDMITIWIDWLGEDICLLTLSNVSSSVHKEPLKEKIKRFIEYLCKEKKIDSNFYKAIAEKQLAREAANAKETKI